MPEGNELFAVDELYVDIGYAGEALGFGSEVAAGDELSELFDVSDEGFEV